ADPELAGAPDVRAHPVADHERLLGAHPRKLEGAVEHRAVRLAPADAVRARDAVDRIGEAEAPPVLADPVVAAPQGVRHEDHGEPLRLAPPERLGGARGETGDGVEGHAAERADRVDLDVVERDALATQPALD